MKNCTFEKYLLPFMTQELASEQYSAVSRHVAECAGCAAILAEMQGVENFLHAYERPTVPHALYAEYRREMNGRFGRATLRRRLFGEMRDIISSMTMSRALGYRLARTFVILFLGVMIGRYLVLQPSAPPPVAEQAVSPTPALTAADMKQLSDYLVQAEQLLLTIANTSGKDVADDDLFLNKDVAKRLLSKSITMQRKAGALDDESITTFLNHLEFILLEMSNRKDDDIHSAFQDIRDMVNEAGLVKKSMQLQVKMARSMATSA